MKKNIKGFSIVLVFVFIVLVGLFGIIVINKQNFFEKNLEYNTLTNLLLKDIMFEGNNIIKENVIANKDFGLYKPFLSCPKQVSYFSSNILIGTFDTILTDNIDNLYGNNKVYCSGELLGKTINIFFYSSYNSFFNGSLIENGIKKDFYLHTTPNPDLTETINSDDIVTNEKISFTNSKIIDESFINSRVEKKSILYKKPLTNYNLQNVFWSNTKMSDFINSNTNNNGNYSKIGDVTNGNLYLDISGSFTGTIIEFDKNIFNKDSKLEEKNIYYFGNLNSQIAGYLQNDLTISTNSTSNNFNFDFKNKDYAIFLGNNSSTNNIKYSLRVYSNNSTVYINPVKDDENKVEYLGGNIIKNKGVYISKVYKISNFK